MTGSMNDMEDRLRSAVRAETADVSPADGSLDAIRTRVRTVRRRRRATLAGAGVAAVVLAAVLVPRVADDTAVTTSDDRATTTTPDAPSSTTTTTQSPLPSSLDQAIWPDPASSSRYVDPVDAARSFVEGFLGYVAGPLSEFRAGEPGAGEIDVLSRDENGQTTGRVAATLSLRQLDGDNWYVTSAVSDSVQIDSPRPLADVASPLHVTGQGRGYEGTVVVAVHERTASADLLGEEPAIAGSADTLEPFSVDVAFEVPSSPIGILVAGTDSGASGVLAPFAALPVRLSDGAGPAPGSDTSPATTVPPASDFRSQPLWPFRTQAEADAWLATADEGHSPWHADAEATALSFTNGYLGFTEIDLVTSSDVRATEAWIGVGYEPDPGHVSTSAVIHLVRFGPDPEAPWEVVGTRDTALTLDTPSYGSAVSSPVSVGGTITGVDENLRVQVRQPSSPEPIGESCCLPGGGEATPWETSVSFAGATDPALTIVVSTGGHAQGVEIFAVTGVHG
jgi:hypothetical protein